MKHFIPRLKLKDASGVSLIELLIALAILSVVVIGGLQMITNQHAAITSTSHSIDKAAIGHYVLNFTDCPQTLAANAAACKTNGEIQLLTVDGRQLASNSIGQVGPHQIKATCDNETIDVQIKSAKSSTWRPLFGEGIPLFCGQNSPVCAEGQTKLVYGDSKCPANSVAYAADDGKFPWFACCALPSNDILDPTSSAQVRAGECASNEVVVGAAAGNRILCQKLNTSRYQLGSPSAACYFGKGASGSSGAGKCGAPNKFLAELGPFGSDGCVAKPGAVVIGYRGKNCGDIKTRPVIRISDGQKINFP